MKYIEFIFYFGLIYLIYFKILSNVHYPIPFCQPVWHKTIYTPFATALVEEGGLTEFKRQCYHFENILFFYDSQGSITHNVRLDSKSKVSISKKNYITYNEEVGKLTLFKNNGEPLWSMDIRAYPILSDSGNHLILIYPDGISFSIYNLDRNEILARTYMDSTIIDIASCPFNDSLLLGSISGEVLLIDYNGVEIFRKTFSQGGEYSYLKSVSISKDGLYFAVLAGLYPEHLILLNAKGEEQWRVETLLDRREPTRLFIDPLNDQLIEPGRGEIYIRSLKNGQIEYVLDLKDIGIVDIRFLIADFKKGTSLIGVNGNDNN
ncbi:MAG: hypothetical protein MPK62_14890, partial [Alphaproteobacteria bacterium]|nr:hypothetical protein [Alphaproteobacteria bacterium]